MYLKCFKFVCCCSHYLLDWRFCFVSFGSFISKILTYNYNTSMEMDCLAFHQWFCFSKFLLVSHSSTQAAVMFSLMKWSNGEDLIGRDHRQRTFRSHLLFYLLFFLSFSCQFLCNLTWRCSLWQFKDNHLGSVSFPETNGRWNGMHVGDRETQKDNERV